ncbi:3827_t:CDS:2 [Funneliformis geosporum]|nr:3827_t:CDS:2 [Funneliformis geosporum]
MSKPHQNSFLLLILLFTIINVNNAQNNIIRARYTHNAHLIDNKLWIFGGGIIAQGTFSPTSSVFYVDLTKKFDVENVEFEDLPLKDESPFLCAWCQSAVGGKDNLTVFFFAGVMLDPSSFDPTTSTSYSFDIKTSKWSVATFTGSVPSKRRELQPATDTNGRIYMFGGGADAALNIKSPQVYRDMYILDSISLVGTTGSKYNAPLARIDYTATILPDGIIVYIGGSEANTDLNFINVDINKIQKYDTKTNTWALTVATGEKTNNRAGHSAALAKNGQIIVFGGIYLPALLPSSPQVVILDTSTPTYQWILPPIMTTTDKPPDLLFHTATIVENYMIIAFGNRTVSDKVQGQSGRLYFLDLEKFEWVKTYNPPADLPKSKVNDSIDPNKKSKNQIMIISIVVVVVLLCIGITSIGIIYYKKNQQTNQYSNGTSTYASQPPPNVMNQQPQQYNNNMSTPNNLLQQPRQPQQLIQYAQSNVLPSNVISSNYNRHHRENVPSADYNDLKGFDVPPDQPYGVVMYNTESGEMYVPSNMSTSSFPDPSSNNYMK